jgi:hypothetical protein
MSFNPSSVATEPPLQSALAEIAEIDKKLVSLNGDIDELKERRASLEEAAIREMNDQRLDGVKVAGRSWRIEHDHFMSVSEDRKELVMRAAKAAGIAEAIATVNTARLKSLLKEMSAGRDARGLYSDGTPFEGLVAEHVAPRLRHVTVR